MKKLIGKLALVTAVVSLMAACDNSAPDQVMVPNADELVSSGSGKIADTKVWKNPHRVEGIIDSNGGSITVGGHTLYVPAGAVSSPTKFLMQVVEANKVHVKLQAWRVSDGASVTQFPNVPVQLKLDATDVLQQEGFMAVAYLIDRTYDGRQEVQPSAYNAATNSITAWLKHFSEYVIIFEKEPPPPPPSDGGSTLP